MTKKFQCMLAASEIPSAKEVPFPVFVSVKLDGIRCVITDGVAMSRKMLPLPNRFLQQWVKDNAEALQGFDGELIVGPPNLESTFNTASSGIMSADGEPDFRFYVFDLWNEPMPARIRQTRLKARHDALMGSADARVILLEQSRIDGPMGGNDDPAGTLSAVARSVIDQGFEGLILRQVNSPYKNGRSTLNEGYLLKWKEFDYITCRIDGLKQAMTNTNEQVRDETGKAKRSTAKAGKVKVESLGGFVVTCVDPTSKYEGKEFSVGPGNLTEEQRNNLWIERSTLPGRLIRVKVQASGMVGLPRFPMFNAWVSPMNQGGVDDL